MMSPALGNNKQKESFTVLSFLQCKRHSKSGSHDSGISSTGNRKNQNDVICISDDENSSEPEFEMICGVEFDHSTALPMPIEQKFICKVEEEGIHETNIVVAERQPLSQFSPTRVVKEELDATTNLDECEEELLPLCKAEDTMLRNSNYMLFICPQCGISYDSIEEWKTHVDAAHNLSDQCTFNFTQCPNNKFQCNKCQAIITRCTLKTLQQHRFTHLPFKVYKCKLCRHEERSLYLMISHIMLHKEKEDLVEIVDSEQTATPIDSVLEIESKRFIAYICPVCGVSFDAEDVWQAHINFQHNFLEKTAINRFDDHFKCTECNVEIFSQHVSDLQKHLFTHLPYKSFLKCKLCNWAISRRNFMLSHIQHLHKANLKLLAASPRVVSKADVGSSDMMSTSLPCVFNYETDEEGDEDGEGTNAAVDDDDDEDYEATIAPKRVRVNKRKNARKQKRGYNSMTSELRTHVQERSAYRKRGFMCTRCFHYFPTADERNAHNVAEHGKYVCEKCNQNFALKKDIKRHTCNEEAKPTFECPRCFKEYNYEKCYLNHMRRCARSAVSTN